MIRCIYIQIYVKLYIYICIYVYVHMYIYLYIGIIGIIDIRIMAVEHQTYKLGLQFSRLQSFITRV